MNALIKLHEGQREWWLWDGAEALNRRFMSDSEAAHANVCAAEATDGELEWCLADEVIQRLDPRLVQAGYHG